MSKAFQLFVILSIWVGAFVLYKSQYLVRQTSPLISKSHSPGKLEMRGDRIRCTSINPCGCHLTKDSCICNTGSIKRKNCQQTSSCHWDESLSPRLKASRTQGRLACRSCSTMDCNACPSEQKCALAKGGGCSWSENDNTCRKICTANTCSACLQEHDCNQHSSCQWDIDTGKCAGECSERSCGLCNSYNTCENQISCRWDKSLQYCMKKCIFNELLGLGCWTCESKDMCTDLGNAVKCKWNEQSASCTRSELQELHEVRHHPYYGNVVNPTKKLFSHIERVLGDVGFYHESRNNVEVPDLETLYGNIIINSNDRLEHVSFPRLVHLKGNIIISGNPVLKTLTFNPLLQHEGCLDVDTDNNQYFKIDETVKHQKSCTQAAFTCVDQAEVNYGAGLTPVETILSVAGKDKCCEQCKDRSKCFAWTFETEKLQCTLFSDIGSTAVERHEGIHSGIRCNPPFELGTVAESFRAERCDRV